MEELVKDIGEVLASKILSRADGEAREGICEKTLSNHVTQGRKPLSDHTVRCLEGISQLLRVNTPGQISASQSDVLHIYVDAFLATSSYSGLGCLVINMMGEQLSFFSAQVEDVS